MEFVVFFVRNTTRKATYVWRNIMAPSYKHFCRGRTKCVTCNECMFVASGIQLENAHAPHGFLQSTRFYQFFPHYSIRV